MLDSALRKFTIDAWDELALEETEIRVVGTVDGVGSVYVDFKIYIGVENATTNADDTGEVEEENTGEETTSTDGAVTTTPLITSTYAGV